MNRIERRMAKSRRKVDNQQVDVDLEDAPEVAIAAPLLPEPVAKKRYRAAIRKVVAAETPVSPEVGPPADTPEPDPENPEKIPESPSPPVVSVVESPVVEASPPVVEVLEEPKKEVAAAVSPRREKKPPKPENPETERFWHLKRMR